MKDERDRLRSSPRPPGKALQTLTEHNWRSPSRRPGTPAGVLCPLCAAAGRSTEMLADTGLEPVMSKNGDVGSISNSVMCPCCRYVGIKVDR